MTIEEAIERYTSNAEYERTHGNLQGCLEFRQLAEWLKDYKRLKEQEPCEMTAEDYISCNPQESEEENMTDREKAIVMAYTGICMLSGDKFQIFHQYVENILGRPVQTIEMSMESVVDEIKEKSREDFIALCREDQEQCGDCIRRSDIGLTDFEIVMCDGDYKEGLKMLLEKIEKAPSVTPAPKIGHWIKCIDDNGSSYYLCSACRCGENFKFDFCPNCGSKNNE